MGIERKQEGNGTGGRETGRSKWVEKKGEGEAREKGREKIYNVLNFERKAQGREVRGDGVWRKKEERQMVK